MTTARFPHVPLTHDPRRCPADGGVHAADAAGQCAKCHRPPSTPSVTISSATRELAIKALLDRLAVVEVESERLLTYRPDPAEHANHLADLEAEYGSLKAALKELMGA